MTQREQDVTIGELYRVLLEVREQTTITNGRLRSAESTIAQHTWAIATTAAVAVVWLGVWLTKVL
jgi:hypothetical protein